MEDLFGFGSARPGAAVAGGSVATATRPLWVLEPPTLLPDPDDIDEHPIRPAGLRRRTVVSREILGMRVDATSYEHATGLILDRAARGEAGYVCVATVNNVIEARDDRAYRTAMQGADLVTPDGMPLVWALRLLGERGATRVYGPALTPMLCRRAQELDVPIGLLGGTPEVLGKLADRLQTWFPNLSIAYRYSPPFRALTEREDERIVADINASGTRLLLVGLGAPKQEGWMADHTHRIAPVMVGVGAAFDFLAGTKRMAPHWIQGMGMEWCFRLMHEPRRLWRRYAFRNPRFVMLFSAQVLTYRASRRRGPGPATHGVIKEGP